MLCVRGSYPGLSQPHSHICITAGSLAAGRPMMASFPASGGGQAAGQGPGRLAGRPASSLHGPAFGQAGSGVFLGGLRVPGSETQGLCKLLFASGCGRLTGKSKLEGCRSRSSSQWRGGLWPRSQSTRGDGVQRHPLGLSSAGSGLRPAAPGRGDSGLCTSLNTCHPQRPGRQFRSWEWRGSSLMAEVSVGHRAALRENLD